MSTNGAEGNTEFSFYSLYIYMYVFIIIVNND